MRKAKITGFKELRANMKNQRRRYIKAVDTGVLKTAIGVLTTTKESILKQSLGREYKRGTITHIASKEGDAPNSDTGRLVQSIEISHKRLSGVARIGSNLDYAVYLEMIRNRPFLVPAVKKHKKKLKRNIEFEVGQVGL